MSYFYVFISMATFEKFLNDFLDGNVEEYMKSEPVPDNSENAVKVRVLTFCSCFWDLLVIALL